MLAVAATTRSLLVAWLPLALVPLFAPLIHAQDPTTVSVFLPGYKGEEMWSQLRGSIVSSVRLPTLTLTLTLASHLTTLTHPPAYQT